MRISTKCSIAIHTLILVGMYSQQIKLTSELIAKSTGCNPVIIRNLFQMLQDQNIIKVKRGVNGGVELIRSPEQITIWDIYQAVQTECTSPLIGIHPHPYENCPVGAHIKEVLAEPYQQIFQALQNEMEQYTLAMLITRFQEINPHYHSFFGNHSPESESTLP